jgi:CpeT protein
MSRTHWTLALALAPLLAACGDKDTDDTAATDDTGETSESVDLEAQTADRLAAWLEGDYDSADHEARDYSYFAISLRMCAIDLPELGERVLYVEQALMDDLSSPYRQRLYRVMPVDDTTAVSEVWQATDDDTDDALVGLCDDPSAFAFAAEDFEERDGCGVIMTWGDTGFEGGTNEEDCLSGLNGATYATAIVSLAPHMLTSWDRGFDDGGEQVWGAVDGAYEFVRRSAAPGIE